MLSNGKFTCKAFAKFIIYIFVESIRLLRHKAQLCLLVIIMVQPTIASIFRYAFSDHLEEALMVKRSTFPSMRNVPTYGSNVLYSGVNC